MRLLDRMRRRDTTTAPDTTLAKGASIVPYAKTPPDVAAAMAAQGLDYRSVFAPGTPLTPYSGVGGLPRAWNMPTGYNIVSRPQRDSRVSFEILKALTSNYDIARMCIGHRIDDVRSLGFAITPKRGFTGDADAIVERAEQILAYPEGPGGTLPFHAWIAKYLEDVLRYDAGALFRRRDRAGRVIGLKVVSGTTIAPVQDYWGDTPESPAPAYVQFVQGVPWKWLSTQDLIYVPFRPQPDSPYGFAPLESVLINANTDIRFQVHFLQWFTAGTVPDGFATLPEGIDSPKQVGEWQAYWDALLYGDTEAKHQIKFVPAGTTFEWPKDSTFDQAFPLYLMRKTAAAFHITPNDLGWTETVNRATADTQVDVQFRIGTLPLVEHVERILNNYLQQDRGLPVEFHFDTGQEKEDRLVEAQRWQICVDSAAASPDEMRSKLLGLPADPKRPVGRFYSTQRLGPIPLLAIEGVAGRVDPETYGPAADQPALDQPFVPPIGVIPHQGTTDDAASLAATDAYQIASRKQLSAEQAGNRETPQQYQQRAARQPAPPAPTAAAATGQQAAPADQAPSEQAPQAGPSTTVAKSATLLSGAEAAELATFRRFVKQRERFGEWRDFAFTAIGPELGAELNAGGAASVLAKQVASQDTAREVYAQLAEDFPPEAIAWVLTVEWTGPELVPLDQVDFSNREDWAAAHEPKKVDKTIRKIERGKPVKPAILIERPGVPDAIIADGHHRALAARAKGVPVRAYVAHTGHATGPWQEMHSSQVHGPGLTQAAPLAKQDQDSSENAAAAGPVAAGLAVRAADTGRVLMLQRAQVDDDPAAGTWEFPGGKLEDGEHPAVAAAREWAEETGMQLPDGEPTGLWTSPDDVYVGYVWTIPAEADLPIFDGRDEVDNPDDPDGDHVEALAWWDPAQLPGNSAVRDELGRCIEQLLGALGVAYAHQGDTGQCPCGIPTVFDPDNGWTHEDGSFGHDDSQTVAEKMGLPVVALRKSYPEGQTYSSHAFRPTPQYERLCWYCGMGQSDPVHAAYRNLAKADDSSPKATAPDDQGPPQPSWPGWGPDLRAAEHWAPLIAAALLAAVNVRHLAASWTAHHRSTAALNPSTSANLARQWAENYRDDLTAALAPVLEGIWTDGALIGSSAARAYSTGDQIDLGRWTPGNLEAARALMDERGDSPAARGLTGERGGSFATPGLTGEEGESPAAQVLTGEQGDAQAARALIGERGDGSGLRAMLDRADVTIKSIVDTRLEELGKVLAEAAASGESPDVVAQRIEELLEDPRRAHMIAVTELSRASNAGAMAYYSELGLDGKSWITEESGVCPICIENGDAGIIPADDPFPSGSFAPPEHPWCRCAVAGRRLEVPTDE